MSEPHANNELEPIAVEAEVLPAEETQLECVPPQPTDKLQRLNRAFGPVVAGLIIDFLDLATFGPIGLLAGPPIGGLAGYWMGRALGFSKRNALWCALLAGIYCATPFTEFVPIATLIGALARYYESGKTKAEEGSQSAETRVQK